MSANRGGISVKKLKYSGLPSQTTKDLSVKYAPFFQVHNVYFSGGCRFAFVNTSKFDMGVEALEEDGTMLVALDALEKIYSPAMRVECLGDSVQITYREFCAKLSLGSTNLSLADRSLQMEKPLCKRNGHIFISVEDLMCNAFGKYSAWNTNFMVKMDYLGVGDNECDIFPDRLFVGQMNTQLRKNCGVLRMAYYFEPAKLLQPYVLYVPTTYDPTMPTKLVVYLHGAGGGVGDCRDLSFRPGAFEEAAERHHAILLMPEGYATGFYGAYSPKVDPENATDEERKIMTLCEDETMGTIRRVMQEYNIDSDNVFLFGNSMGGAGTFYLTRKYPRHFRACAPCGCLHDVDLFSYDMSSLRGKPLLFVMGTENIDIQELPRMVRQMRELGVDASSAVAPGRYHKDGYCYCMEEIFSFFDRYATL